MGNTGCVSDIPCSLPSSHPPPSPPLGERELPEHQPGDPDAGQKEGQAALLPQRPAGERVRREVPWLPAEQLSQPTALLAAPLPQQGQRQHLSGERELPLTLPLRAMRWSKGAAIFIL